MWNSFHEFYEYSTGSPRLVIMREYDGYKAIAFDVAGIEPIIKTWAQIEQMQDGRTLSNKQLTAEVLAEVA